MGEPGSSELSVVAGETLLVTRQDVGEGWWEGTSTAGRTGLFPAAYVEVCFYHIFICIVLIIGFFLSLLMYVLTINRKLKLLQITEQMKANHHQLYHHRRYLRQQIHGKLTINKMNTMHKYPAAKVSNRIHIYISRLVYFH